MRWNGIVFISFRIAFHFVTISFCIGPSMQDISRDELTLLQTGCDKDSILTNNDSAFDRIKLGRTPELETLPASIKLEDTADAFQWNTTSSSSSNIESNLLYVHYYNRAGKYLQNFRGNFSVFSTACIFRWKFCHLPSTANHLLSTSSGLQHHEYTVDHTFCIFGIFYIWWLSPAHSSAWNEKVVKSI